MILCDYGCGRESKHQLKSGKKCCEEFYNKCPEVRRKNSQGQKRNGPFVRGENPNYISKMCRFCGLVTTLANLTRHEKLCYLNPLNLKLCPVCEKPIKNYRENKTCSHDCANGLFRQNLKDSSYIYRDLCFSRHDKKCVICSEERVVWVHHLDENRSNNSPENLLPLCPTHHIYIHCELKELIKEQVDKYVKKFIEGLSNGKTHGFDP